ncbi:transposable element Tcb2 transposase [Trichonephila clavipes]|nr:transposable element Tcb2 transposase [Trichonephila clavipes]
MALYRSPLTVMLWPSSFLKNHGPMIPPAHKAHQTAHLLWISLKGILLSKDPSLWAAVKHHIKIKQDPPEEVTSIQDLVTKDDNEILEEIFIEAVNFVAPRYAEVDMPLRSFRRQHEQLPQFEKGRIIGMMEAGWSARRIARQLGRTDCVVRKRWDQWIREISFTRRPGSGRPRQTSR